MDEMRIIEEDSKFIGDNYFQEGIKNAYAQNYEAAFLNFNKSRTFYPNNSATWNNMGAAILRAKGEGAFPDARSYIEKSLYLEPNNSIYLRHYGYFWYYLGSSFYFNGNYTGSLEAINKAINLGINEEGMWYVKGALAWRLENSSEQLKTYEEIINRCTDCDPTFLSIMWHNKGVFIEKNEFAALEAFDKSIQLYHNDTESWNGWRVALLSLGGLADTWVNVSNGNVTNCTS